MKSLLLAFSLFLLAFFLFTTHPDKKKRDLFNIAAIKAERPFDSFFETASLSESQKKEAIRALSQPYEYFGCGGQAYACFSQDGRYVIKFFKQRLFRPSFWLQTFPLPDLLTRFRDKRLKKRLDKLFRDFTSYKLAFEKLQEETEVLFVHLNPTTELKTRITVTDKQGKEHLIDLDSTSFLLQRRAVPVYDYLDVLMKSGKVKQAEEAISQICLLIHSRCKKGFQDGDPNIRTNTGFVFGKAIKIDVGRLMENESMKDPQRIINELMVITSPFKKWLEQKHPSLVSSLEKNLSQLVEGLQ